MSRGPAAAVQRTTKLPHGAPATWAARADLPGGPLLYTVSRSARARRLRVTIDPERGVLVTLPASRRPPSARSVEGFLADREAWLRRHLERQAAARAAAAEGSRIEDGGCVVYLGQQHRLRVAPAAPGARRSTVSRIGGEEADELLVSVVARERRALGDILEAWFRVRARTAIDREIEHHAGALGVEPTGITIRDQRTRWGSASRHGRLAFSWRLVLAPPEILESVVIHELAHLRVFGHGPKFWALVETRCPDYRTRRTWLRQHRIELHAVLAKSAAGA